MLHRFPQGVKPNISLLRSFHFHPGLSFTSGRAVSQPCLFPWSNVERTQAVGILVRVQGDREGRIPEEPRAIFISGMPHSFQRVELRSRSQYKDRVLSVFGQPRRLRGFEKMNKAHSVWSKPSGDCLGKGGAISTASLIRNWTTAFVHEAKVLSETPAVVSYSRTHSSPTVRDSFL